MNNLWQWSEVCQAVGASPCDGPDIFGISIDTRTLVPGDLFIALNGDPGERYNTSHQSTLDGHDYIQQALDAGAAGVLVHRADSANLTGEKYILVDDTLDSLWDLARAARKRLHCPVFAITGSSGKTTLRNFLGTCLDIKVAPGSLNNFWGVPLSMSRTPRNSSAAIFELGTNSPGEIAPLAKLVQPNVAVVLNVLAAHLEYFEGLDAIRKEKLSISLGLDADGVLVVPSELKEHTSAGRVVCFGEDEEAEVCLIDYNTRDQSVSLRIQADTGSSEFQSLKVPGGGQHRAYTVAATQACLLAAKQASARILKLNNLQPPVGRGNCREAAGMQIIDDSYNANPASMAQALLSITDSGPGKNYAILGDMLELGQGSDRFHEQLLPACEKLEAVFCVGTHMHSLYQAMPTDKRWGYAKDSAGIDLQMLKNTLEPGDRVLIKGSNRMFWAQGFVDKFVEFMQ